MKIKEFVFYQIILQILIHKLLTIYLKQKMNFLVPILLNTAISFKYVPLNFGSSSKMYEGKTVLSRSTVSGIRSALADKNNN